MTGVSQQLSPSWLHLVLVKKFSGRSHDSLSSPLLLILLHPLLTLASLLAVREAQSCSLGMWLQGWEREVNRSNHRSHLWGSTRGLGMVIQVVTVELEYVGKGEEVKYVVMKRRLASVER